MSAVSPNKRKHKTLTNKFKLKVDKKKWMISGEEEDESDDDVDCDRLGVCSVTKQLASACQASRSSAVLNGVLAWVFKPLGELSTRNLVLNIPPELLQLFHSDTEGKDFVGFMEEDLPVS